MKLILLITLFIEIGSGMQSKAQTIPIDTFFKNGATWTTSYYSYSHDCSHCSRSDTSAEVYRIGADTIIGGVRFLKLSYKSAGGFGTGNTFSNITPVHFQYGGNSFLPLGRLRLSNDSMFFTNDVIPSMQTSFAYMYPLGQEKLLYLFNPAVGQQVPTSLGTQTIITIDSIAYNGTFLKKYNFYNNDYYIQGLGSGNGFLNCITNSHNSYTSNALCYSDNTSLPDYHFLNLFLPAQLAANCFDVSSLGIERLAADSDRIQLYPSPLLTDFFYLKTNDPYEVYSVILYTADGKVVDKYDNVSATNPGPLHIHSNASVIFATIINHQGQTVFRKLTHP